MEKKEEIEARDFNKYEQKKSLEENDYTAPDTHRSVSLDLRIPNSTAQFFHSLKEDETIFQRLNKNGDLNPKNNTKTDMEVPPRTSKKFSSSSCNFQKQRKSEIPRETAFKKSSNKIRDNAKIEETNRDSEDSLSIADDCDIDSSSENQKSNDFESNKATFTLSSFNSPDTMEVAMEEDRFWRQEREDPILDTIFQDYDKKNEFLNIDANHYVQDKMRSLKSNLKKMWGGRQLTGILKVGPKRKGKQSISSDVKRRKARKVSFNQRVRVKLISPEKRKSLHILG